MIVARIFFVLACFATLLLISNLGVGLWVGDLNGDATVSTVVAYHEGQLDEVVFNDPDADIEGDGETQRTAS